jgi:FdrA protein
MCLLAQAGCGISQAIGCGGRDLCAEVGGATTLQALRLLQEDERTRVIVLISKPPAPEVAEKVLAEAARGPKPVVALFLNTDLALWQGRLASTISLAHTLTEAAQMAASLCGVVSLSSSIAVRPEEEQARHPQTHVHAGPPYLAALYSGGTLCDEALHIWGTQLGPVYSNLPLRPDWLWREGQTPPGHYALDLGADEYTRGRPHPMIDPEARLKYLRAAADDPRIGVILLDIVLGYCAHPDPAAIYGPLIQESIGRAVQAGRRLDYVISLCGTEEDPQRLSYQENLLRQAGAETYRSNAQAAERCLALLSAQRAWKE